jgi:uncharacterized cofD-like protein
LFSQLTSTPGIIVAEFVERQIGNGKVEIYNRQTLRATMHHLNLVAIGGGTGLSNLLCGLKHYLGAPEVVSSRGFGGYTLEDLTAIVSVADDGGSSGRLREEFDILAPGDIRNCMVGLADDEKLLTRLFRYRFPGEGALGGHNVGNLLLTALTSVTGNFLEAIRCSSELLGIKARILPSTLAKVGLVAELDDGTIIRGQHKITKGVRPISRLRLDPSDCLPLKDALEAIEEADLIVIGPGSLFTSLIPNLLVKGIPEAIMRSPAKKLFVCNLLTEPGETNGYSAEDHIQRLLAYFTKQVFDLVLVNYWPISEATYQRYHADGMRQVRVKEPGDVHAERGMGSLVLAQGRYQVPVLHRDLVDEKETGSHHRGKLAGAIFEAYELLATERLDRFCYKGKFR